MKTPPRWLMYSANALGVYSVLWLMIDGRWWVLFWVAVVAAALALAPYALAWYAMRLLRKMAARATEQQMHTVHRLIDSEMDKRRASPELRARMHRKVDPTWERHQ